MKTKTTLCTLASALTLAVAGCGSDGGSSTDIDAAANTIDAGGGIDAALPAGYTRLIGRTWSLPGGQPDTYKCVRFTATRDMFITGFKAQAPLGTHHTVLSIANTGSAHGADGEYDCSVGSLGLKMLFASGVGTQDYDFPSGAAIKITAGDQVHLNLHLYNTSDSPISGDSAILIKTVPAAPTNLAEMVFAGKFLFNISGNQPGVSQIVSGGCTVAGGRDYQLFAVWPHMHQLATHQKVTLTHAGTTTVLHDDAFAFGEQNFFEQAPQIHVVGGDQIRVECTYVNNTGHNVPFGDSSDAEMCFSGLYRYPSTNSNLFECTDNPTGAGL
jgi:Copper type II ascorbate-dependent monooxygenase, C-terminal domain